MANLFLTGSGLPTPAIGEVTDYYRDTGTNLIYYRSPTGWEAVPSLIPTPDGVGTTWHFGNGAPSNGVGSSGDYYRDDDNGSIYRKHPVNGWESKGSLDFIGVYGVQWGEGSGAPANIPPFNNLPAGSFYLDVDTSDIYYKDPSLTWSLKGQLGGDSADNAATSATNAANSASAASISATNASNSASVALTSATNASNAQLAAEAARDAAIVTGKVYADTTAGLAATTNGQYFNVVSTVTYGALDLYLNNAGVAVFKKTYPSIESVDSIKSFAGKYNAWPDPFFRRFNLTDRFFLGKNRWYSNSGMFTNVSLVQNHYFDGFAIRRAQNAGTTPLSGFVVYLSELNATVGDTITVYTLFTGTSGTISCPARFDNGSDNGWVGGQLNPVNTTGGNSITSPSSTPQWLRHSVVVPSGATRLVVYPYTTTPNVTFDIVSFWGFKGNPANNPDWPTQGDEFYYRLRDQELTEQTNINQTQKQTLDYITLNYGVVSASAEVINLAATNPSTNTTYSNSFTGWGERYSPAGVSFNAVRIKNLGRNIASTTVKWRVINIVVRTGANSHLSGSSVIAVGSIQVIPDHDVLTDITILLRDPNTNAIKTLTDADFSGGEYFIGVYARNDLGVGAGMSPHTATQSNTLGQSYYVTNINPLTGTWSTFASNARVGVDHLFLTSPVEEVAYSITTKVLTQIADNLPPPALSIAMPPKIYLLAGREVSLYFDNLIANDFDGYLWDVSGATTGSQQRERYTTNPSTAIASHNISVVINDKFLGKPLSSSTINVVGVASSANTGTTKKCLLIGDSLTQDGTITQTLLDIAATDAMGLTLIGTRGSGSNKHEGRGGWTVSDYTTAGRTFYSFVVSGVTTPPQINSTTYTNNSSTFLVQEVSISSGSGTIICERTSGSNAPSSSGTLTKSNAGVGDSTISFGSSASVSGNPFWISSAINFSQYLTNNSLVTPDVVLIMLGINDVFSATSDQSALSTINERLTMLDTLINSIKATNGTIKVALIPPPPPSSSQDAFAVSYGVGQTRWICKRNMILWAKTLYAKYAGQEASRVYICPANVNLDTVNNMQTASSAPVNSRSSVSVIRQNNGVHPATSGYQQLADAIWAFLKNV